MIKRGLVLFLALLLVLAPGALAFTIVVDDTEPYHNLILRILNPSNGEELKTFYPKADSLGRAEVEYSSNFNELSFVVIVKHPLNREIVDQEEFDEIDVESEILLDMNGEAEGYDNVADENLEESSEGVVEEEIPVEGGEEVAEPEESSEEAVVEESSEVSGSEEATQSAGISGLFISKAGGLTNTAYYLLGAIIVIIIVFLVVARARYGFPGMPPHLRRKMTFDEEFRDAQMKLKEATRELKELKKERSEITDAEAEFNRAKEKLEKLRKGSADDLKEGPVKKGSEKREDADSVKGGSENLDS